MRHGKARTVNRRIGVCGGWLGVWLCFGILLGLSNPPAWARETVHGLWVWDTFAILQAPETFERLRDFCKAQHINEVYVSVAGREGESDDVKLAELIRVLHRAHIRVEALFGSSTADQPGKPREELLTRIKGILDFNREHKKTRFDGIHLDVEPYQREENKGLENRKFLPDLVQTYHEVQGLAANAGMTVNADIPNRLLKGSLSERWMLLSSLPRLTLMLYELSSPGDGDTPDSKAAKLRTVSNRSFKMAYDGVTEEHVARMSVALNTPDYEQLLPLMVKTLDDAHHRNKHYLGWARHSYNSYLETAKTFNTEEQRKQRN
jgi:hypothetical protein